MKRLLAIILSLSLMLTACSQNMKEVNIENVSLEETEENGVELVEENLTTEISIPEDEMGDDTPYHYEMEFDSLNDEDLQRYIRDELYDEVVTLLDSDDYFVENISTSYVSQEYIDELNYNSKPNVYFGYTLEELDELFDGTRYVFTLGDNGETIVVPFEGYDDTYNQVLKNVAVGTGVILVCVTVSVVTAEAGAPAVSMIFAASAKMGTDMALSQGVLSGVIAGTIKGIQTGDVEETISTVALSASEGFKWGAIVGVVSGGVSETVALKGATLNGLTMNEAASIQKESKYPLDVIKQFHTVDEYKVFKTAELKSVMVNGQTALVRSDINLDLVDEFGRTNLKRMESGLAPLDENGISYELHHIGQESDATLAILTQSEHDSELIHGFKTKSVIDRKAFAKQKRNFWKTMAQLLEEGAI
jgi:hypothetical protein